MSVQALRREIEALKSTAEELGGDCEVCRGLGGIVSIRVRAEDVIAGRQSPPEIALDAVFSRCDQCGRTIHQTAIVEVEVENRDQAERLRGLALAKDH